MARSSRASSPSGRRCSPIDHGRRGAIRANHSATHLLHEALRQGLGIMWRRKEPEAPDRLRFDFSQPDPIGRDDLARVEAELNASLRRTPP